MLQWEHQQHSSSSQRRLPRSKHRVKAASQACHQRGGWPALSSYGGCSPSLGLVLVVFASVACAGVSSAAFARRDDTAFLSNITLRRTPDSILAHTLMYQVSTHTKCRGGTGTDGLFSLVIPCGEAVVVRVLPAVALKDPITGRAPQVGTRWTRLSIGAQIIRTVTAEMMAMKVGIEGPSRTRVTKVTSRRENQDGSW